MLPVPGPALHDHYMREAIKLARQAGEAGEVPVGAVIVHGRDIIARAHNQVETLKDPTAHAEMIAVTQATSFLGGKWLQDCTLYVTIEPCSMCAGALTLARIDRVVYGAADPKTGACGSVVNIPGIAVLNHHFDTIPGVMAEECGSLVSSFFRSKRRR